MLLAGVLIGVLVSIGWLLAPLVASAAYAIHLKRWVSSYIASRFLAPHAAAPRPSTVGNPLLPEMVDSLREMAYELAGRPEISWREQLERDKEDELHEAIDGAIAADLAVISVNKLGRLVGNTEEDGRNA